ncbi:MAG: hypothetical protein KF760_25370 [Candidatus Eremiobacteraeota bacterium]|nr:hypothetical protein [Candidatus Eremiobacteraeota bacterium]MCW5871456.1 hypothetical protein [Candidatus Eremiobacteraeota bacterium]
MLSILRNLLILLTFGFCVFSSGCGSSTSTLSGNSNPGPSGDAPAGGTTTPRLDLLTEHRANIRVILPTGVSLDLATLKVVNPAGTFPVTSAGDANVIVWNEGRMLTSVVLPNGRPLLFAYLNPNSSEISTVTTAKVLAFFRLGGWILPDDGQNALLAKLTPALLQTITSKLQQLYALNPECLTVSQPDLQKVLDSAVASLLPQVLGKGLVDPTGEQSGVQVALSDDSSSIIVTNRKHRRVYSYITQTQFSRPAGQANQVVQVPINPARAVADFPLSATTGLKSTFGTIADLLSGNLPFAQGVDSDPVPAPIQDDAGNSSAEAASTATYRVVTVGPGYQFSQTTLTPDQDAKVQQLYVESLVLDVTLPALSNVLLPSLGAGKSAEFQRLVGNILPDLVSTLTTALTTALEKFKHGDGVGAMDEIIQGLFTGNEGRQALGQITAILTTILSSDPKFTADTALTALGKFSGAVVLVDAALTGADIAVQYLDYRSCSEGVEAKVLVNRGKVTLSPPQANIDNLSILDLKAHVQDPPPEVEYVWKLDSGPAGATLRSTNAAGAPIGGSSFTNRSPNVSFVPSTGLGPAVVSVEAYEVVGSARNLIGFDQANIQVKAAEISLTPSKRALKKGQKGSFTVVIPNSLSVNTSIATFDFKTTGRFGGFSGGASERRVFGDTGLTIDYFCTAEESDEGTDTVSVEVFVPETEGSGLRSVGTASAKITVNDSTPDVVYGQVYGDSYYAENGGFYESHSGAGWIIPVFDDPDIIRYDCHVFDWADGELFFSFTPNDTMFTVPPTTGNVGPAAGELSLYIPNDPDGLFGPGARYFQKGWAGISGFGPIPQGSDHHGVTPDGFLYRVSPSTCEVRLIRR